MFWNGRFGFYFYLRCFISYEPLIRLEHWLSFRLKDPPLSSSLIQNILGGQLDKFNRLPNPGLSFPLLACFLLFIFIALFHRLVKGLLPFDLSSIGLSYIVENFKIGLAFVIRIGPLPGLKSIPSLVL